MPTQTLKLLSSANSGSSGNVPISDGNGGFTWGLPTGIGGGASLPAINPTTITTAGPLTVAQHSLIDATAGALTMTLPTGQAGGKLLSVAKSDISTNTVTINGNIRGVANSNVTLRLQNEAVLLEVDANGSYWPIADHKTLGSLDARFTISGAAGPGQLPISVANAIGFTSTFVRPSGDTTGATDPAAINTALQAGDVSLSGVYYLNAAILIPDSVELKLIGAEVLVVPGVADNAIRNADQTTTGAGNARWRIKGVGKAIFRNQTSTVFQAATTVGATTATVNSYIAPGSYGTWTASNATTETITISQCVKTGSGQWTITVPAGFSLAHSAGNGIVSAQNRSQGGGGTNAQVAAQIAGYFVNVQNFSIEDVTFGPAGFMAANFQGAVNGRISRVHVGQDRSIDHQDGIDFGPGCQNLLIEGTRGMSSDDFHSIYAKNTGVNISPWAAAQTAAGRNIANLTFVGEQVSPGINYLRIQAGDGSTCTGIHAHAPRWLGPLYDNKQSNSNYRNVIQFGSANYVTTLPNPGDLDDIAVTGFRGPCDSLLALDSIATNVTVHDAQITGSFYGLITNNVANPVNSGGSAITLPGLTGINLLGIRTTYAAASSTGGTQCNVMALASAVSVDKVNITKLRMASSNGLLVNSGTVTNLNAEGWHIGAMTAAPLRSTTAETGSIRGTTIDAPFQQSGSNKTLGAACQLAISQPFPVLNIQDTVPTPTPGSQIMCRGDLDPTGGGSTQGARYTGDGVNWLRDLTMPGLAGPPKFVQNIGTATVPGSSTTVAVPVTNLPSVGNTIFAAVCIPASATVSSVTDPRGNTWTIDANNQGYGSASIALAHAKVTTAYQSGDNVTFNLSATTTNTGGASIVEFASVNGTVDKTASNFSTTGVTAIDMGTTAATTTPTQLVIGAIAGSGALGSITPGSGYTLLTGVSAGTRSLVWIYRTTSTTGAQDPTLTAGTARAYSGITATYKVS